MKRLSTRFSIALATFSIGIGIVAFCLLNRPLPSVDLPQDTSQCASEFEAEVDPIDLSKAWRTKLLLRFQEPPLNKLPANVQESYRLIWVPTFHMPTVVRIWRSGENYYIVSKRLSRNQNNLEIGDLKFEQTRSLTTKEWNNFVDLLNKSCFRDAPSNIKELPETDGASWTFEALSNGQYHFVDRIAPSNKMSEIFRGLFKLTGEEMEYEEYL